MRLFAFLCCLAFLPCAVAAQVQQCAGIWVDRPCDMPQLSGNQGYSDTQRVENAKEQIVADLARFAQRVQRELGRTDFEADGVGDFCRNPQVSVEECRARALRADKSLLSSLQTFSRIRQRALELTQRQQEIALRRERQLRDLKKKRTKNS
ncbi:MAG: hypothetical protein J0M12_16405 [Deltaproteobacteria bacterium]|nr:hypothetical protein [Deltaproteobacteria bacterium]